MSMLLLGDWPERVDRFRQEAHAILATHEDSPSRVVQLDATYKKLSGMTLRQDDLMKQALRCVENGLFRAAHVMAWAAFMDFFEEKLASDGMKKLRTCRPKWTSSTMEDLREEIAEHQIIGASRDVGLCRKNEVKALHGMLNKRNECAHPSDYYPDLNDAIGFIGEVLKRIAILQARSL